MTMHEVCVIGAGWGGLSAANQLRAAGVDVVVLEKARGPGGRCSTRRQDDLAFDHGAQYFTARTPEFAARVKAWKAAGLIAAWKPKMTVFGARPRTAGQPPRERLVGVPGMNAVLKHLAVGLDCRYQWRAERLRREQDSWVIESADPGSSLRARYLLITAPPLQTSALLRGQSALAAIADQVPMTSCWAVMLGFDKVIQADFDAAFDNEGPLIWLARNSSKPARAGETWLLHANPQWSDQHLEAEPGQICEHLLTAFQHRVPSAAARAPSWVNAHRWRYALAPQPLMRECLSEADTGLVVAGDWCAGNRIEGAWRSGLAAAVQIQAWIDS